MALCIVGCAAWAGAIYGLLFCHSICNLDHRETIAKGILDKKAPAGLAAGAWSYLGRNSIVNYIDAFLASATQESNSCWLALIQPLT